MAWPAGPEAAAVLVADQANLIDVGDFRRTDRRRVERGGRGRRRQHGGREGTQSDSPHGRSPSCDEISRSLRRRDAPAAPRCRSGCRNGCSDTPAGSGTRDRPPRGKPRSRLPPARARPDGPRSGPCCGRLPFALNGTCLERANAHVNGLPDDPGGPFRSGLSTDSSEPSGAFAATRELNERRARDSGFRTPSPFGSQRNALRSGPGSFFCPAATAPSPPRSPAARRR